MSRDTIAATLKIHRAGDFMPKGREYIAEWLRQVAEEIENRAEDFSGKYTANYVIVNRNNND